jgi:hypothetical protein
MPQERRKVDVRAAHQDADPLALEPLGEWSE